MLNNTLVHISLFFMVELDKRDPTAVQNCIHPDFTNKKQRHFAIETKAFRWENKRIWFLPNTFVFLFILYIGLRLFRELSQRLVVIQPEFRCFSVTIFLQIDQ